MEKASPNLSAPICAPAGPNLAKFCSADFHKTSALAAAQNFRRFLCAHAEDAGAAAGRAPGARSKQIAACVCAVFVCYSCSVLIVCGRKKQFRSSHTLINDSWRGKWIELCAGSLERTAENPPGIFFLSPYVCEMASSLDGQARRAHNILIYDR